jgi:Protein of unknown function (DUF3616)
MRLCLAVFAGILLHAGCLRAAELVPTESIDFQGEITEPLQLSGVTRHGSLLVLCPDEGAVFDVLAPVGTNSYRVRRSITLSDDPEDEIDMEGAASDGKWLYIVGSHSLARRQLKPKQDYAKNQSLQLQIKNDKTRAKLFRLTLNEGGKTRSSSLNLRRLLRHDRLLSRFTRIPSKENGIDIEGVAVSGKRLYLGFRGPVLRENYVPVMVLDFDSPDEYELRFVNLGGRGIRDLAAVKGGFLLIAGPMSDGIGSYQLCYWNGKDCLPGANAPGGKLQVLGDVPTKAGAKAEGLAVLAEDQINCTLLVLYGDTDGGAPKRFLIKKSWN